MNSPILTPVLLLAAWSMLMWLWMYATRLPAMARAGIDGTKLIGSTGKGLRDELVAKGEERASWVADNYNHLMEQPTLFYAVAISLALLGAGQGLALGLAWGYAGLRIMHSLVQALINRVIVRFVLFALASLCLGGMAAIGAAIGIAASL